jgi:nitroreductase
MLDRQPAKVAACGSPAIDAAMRGRRSVRAFAPIPVPQATVIDGRERQRALAA